MQAFYRAQILLGVLGALIIVFLISFEAARSYFFGVGLITINVLFVQYIWGRIIGKKSVAWTLFVIVFKYTLLITTLYLVAAKGWLSLEWFGLGLGTILLSIFRIKLGSL